MALSFTTGMTKIAIGDQATEQWDVERFSGGGGGPSISTAPDSWREGVESIQSKLAGNNWDSWCMYDYFTDNTATLDLSASGSEVLAIWMQYLTPAVILDWSAGGISVLVQSSTETGTTDPVDYDEWYISGADVYPGGWLLCLIDTRKAPSNIGGAGADLSAVRRIGIRLRNTAISGSVKGEPFYCDAIWYGRPKYTLTGDGTLIADFQDFIDESVINEDGLIDDIGGAYHARCGFAFGADGQTATTTFVDATGKKIIFKQVQYHDGVSVVDALFYEDYYGLTGVGAASFNTAVDIGAVVGTGDDRQGVGGGSISAEHPAMYPLIDFETDIAHLSAVNMYGVGFQGMGVSKFSGSTKTDIIGCTFTGCDEVQPNDCEFLNCFVVACSPDRGVELLSTHTIKQVSFIAGEAADQYATRVYNIDVSATPDLFLEFTAEAAEATANDVVCFPATEAAGDLFVFGAPFKFAGAEVNTGTARSGGSVLLRYWNGSAWATISGATDGTNGLSTTGLQSITFTPPSDWAAVSLKGEAPLFYIGFEVATTFTTNPLVTELWVADQLEHAIHAPVPFAMTASGIKAFGFGAAGGPKYHGENSGTASLVTAGSFVIGMSYKIQTTGTTDFTLIGAADSNPGTFFVATGVGSGTGTAYQALFFNATAGTGTNIAANEFDNTGTNADTTVVNSVTLTITCKNKAGFAIEGIRIRIETTAGTLIVEGETNASGVYSVSYNYGGDVNVNVIARLKKYNNNQAADTIGSTGLSVPFTMLRDPSVNLP